MEMYLNCDLLAHLVPYKYNKSVLLDIVLLLTNIGCIKLCNNDCS